MLAGLVVQGLGFRVSAFFKPGLGFRLWGLGLFLKQGLGFRFRAL